MSGLDSSLSESSSLRSMNSNEDKDLLIPRITFTYELSSGCILLRPLAPVYATTFNSCQYNWVDIDLTQHGPTMFTVVLEQPEVNIWSRAKSHESSI